MYICNNSKNYERILSDDTWIELISIILLSRRRQWHPTPVLLPGKSHGRRSLVGCSPWCHEESDTTERLHFDFSLSCIGGGNGNPLQYSCLENPRDRGAWWAAFYRVAQSRTRLKWLSSSSSLYLEKEVATHSSILAWSLEQWFSVKGANVIFHP